MTDHRSSRYIKKGEDNRLVKMMEASSPQGIAVDPIPITADQEMTILYNGLLAGCGADGVYLHCGYGSSNNWSNIEDIKMEWTQRGWVKTFKPKDDSRLNFCFKDSASNWDNNNGINWSVEVHNGGQY